jgi:hypothetical protein
VSRIEFVDEEPSERFEFKPHTALRDLTPIGKNQREKAYKLISFARERSEVGEGREGDEGSLVRHALSFEIGRL